MENMTLKVEGMHCSGCENRVKNALISLNGITTVAASFENKTVSVAFNLPATFETIKNKIEDLGFEVIQQL